MAFLRRQSVVFRDPRMGQWSSPSRKWRSETNFCSSRLSLLETSLMQLILQAEPGLMLLCTTLLLSYLTRPRSSVCRSMALFTPSVAPPSRASPRSRMVSVLFACVSMTPSRHTFVLVSNFFVSSTKAR